MPAIQKHHEVQTQNWPLWGRSRTGRWSCT